MKIVITGALGHIGSKLLRGLPDFYPQAEIVLLDNFLVQRYPSLFNLPDGGRYRFIEADVVDYPLAETFADAAAVIHLAAITDAAGSIESKDEVHRVNFGATRNVAEACAETHAPMVFISTTSVYGTQKSLVDENCTLEELKPQSPYAETKLREEALLAEMGREAGLKFIACRFGTIFGTSPGMRFHTAVNKFCWQAAMGRPITVWRTALQQKRPYLDLDDGVRAVRFIIDKEVYSNDIYNVLTLNATVSDIVETIRKYVPSLLVEEVDSPIMNQLSYEVLCDKFKALGFEFGGDLEGAISETLNLLKNANSAYKAAS